MHSIYVGLLFVACQVVYNGVPGLALSMDAHRVHRVKRAICTPQQLAADNPTICATYVQLGLCSFSGAQAFVTQNCPVTCGLCEVPPPTTPPPPTLPVCTPEQIAVDNPIICASYIQLGFCTFSGAQALAMQNCPVSCGFCTVPPPTTAPPGITPEPTNATIPPTNATIPPTNATVPPTNATIPPTNATTPPTTPQPPPVCCLYVTLVVFAGRPDPRWLISPKNNYTNNCTNFNCTAILDLLHQARSGGFAFAHSCIPPKTGYKGFLVQTEENMAREELIVGPETILLQLLLLDTMPERLQPSVKFRQGIRSVISSGNVSADCGVTRRKRFAPMFSPDPWNSNENTRRLNNCYNYASTKITNSSAQPGRGSGGPFFPWIKAYVIRDAAIRDGFAELSPHPNASDPVPAAPAGDRHLVALFVAPDICDGDFHFYRLDYNGTWSHKPGQTRVTRLDDSKNNITDPRTADTGDYLFVRFLTVDRNNVTII